MIFVDSNIPMYLVGADHPNKKLARQLLELLVARGERLVSDAEVLQEILHRYAALGRRDAIGPAFEALLGVVDEVFPIELVDVERARRIVDANTTVSARDAVHAAVMIRHEVHTILSFDRGFDRLLGIGRISDIG
ncbi:MAG TPA: type II toxin-antitoxin system VapC family toxin [Candidatus Limnocylindrales bacterium]|nr:type II toxin-antitoxin system VapC family toxin [Candidatus Limnocylindrales bacterium]